MFKNAAYLFAAVLPVALCSCSSFEVTKNLEEALAHVEDDIEYHDRAYMEAIPLSQTKMKFTSIEKIKEGGKLYFNFGFEQGRELGAQQNKNLNVNYLSDNEWAAFKREFEAAIAGSRRFPVAQIHYGMADNELRKKTVSGTSNTEELDPSELVKAEGVINITPMLSVSESLVGKEKTITNTYQLTCNPTKGKNNAPIEGFPSFDVKVQSRVYQLTDKFGRATAGFRFNTSKQLEDYHLRQGRAAIVKFFAKMYKEVPVSGLVTNFDEDGNVLVKVSREEGLQVGMEMVVFALRRADGEDAIPVPIYNATATNVGMTGKSTLRIWRKSDKDGAKKIIRKLEQDIDEARAEYEFFASSDGFAQWPDFVDRQNTNLK